LLTAACVVYLVANTNLADLQQAAQEADYWTLSVALLISGLTVVAKGLRWYVLYPGWARPSAALAIAGIAAGQVANWAIPMRVGEALRVGLVSAANPAQRGRSLAAGTGVLVVEKVFDAALLLVTVGGLILLVGVPTWLSTSALLLALAGSAVGVGMALRLRNGSLRNWVEAARSWLGRRMPTRASSLLEDASGFGDGVSAWLTPGRGLQALMWSVVAWVLGGVVNYVVFKSVGLDPGQVVAATLAVLAALYGAAIVPSLPGRVGIFQYLCVAALAPFGVPLAQALVFSLALYLAIYVPPIAIGLASMVFVGSAPWRPPVARADRRQL